MDEKKKLWRVLTCQPAEAEDLINAFANSGYDLKNVAATEQSGNGARVKVLLVFKLAQQQQQARR